MTFVKPVSRYPTVLFDFDGTMFDTREAIRHTLLDLSQLHAAASISEQRITEVIRAGLSLPDMIRGLVPGAREKEHAAWIAQYRGIYNSGVGIRESIPYPNLRSILGNLQASGVEMFVVSNKGEQSIRETLEFHSLSAFFKAVIATSGNQPAKPGRGSFDLCVKPIMQAALSKEILVVGDTEVDIEYAHNIGAVSCWAAYGYGRREICMRLRPHLVAQSLSDVLEACS